MKMFLSSQIVSRCVNLFIWKILCRVKTLKILSYYKKDFQFFIQKFELIIEPLDGWLLWKWKVLERKNENKKIVLWRVWSSLFVSRFNIEGKKERVCFWEYLSEKTFYLDFYHNLMFMSRLGIDSFG